VVKAVVKSKRVLMLGVKILKVRAKIKTYARDAAKTMASEQQAETAYT